MEMNVAKRDYRLDGEDTKLANQLGLVQAEWYQTPIPRATMKELMKRSDGPAIRDFLTWVALIVLFGAGMIYFWGTWWSLPFIILYGISYSACHAIWHECGHGTAFKTSWMNEAAYQIASFMFMRLATPWRWSHFRHHSDTFIRGVDPEINPRPYSMRSFYLNIFYLLAAPLLLLRMFRYALGKINDVEKSYIPEHEHHKAVWEARVWAAIYVAIITACILMQSILPLMLVGLSTLYGFYFTVFLGISQHLGLYENVLDHRLNARTYLTNRIFRFFYWNMNYHIEHHMFPQVPYFNLPKLHEVVKHDYPAPNPSIWSAFKESIYAIRQQQKDPNHVIVRPLPATANPYKYK
jgi:fatty acid desaturase